MNLDQRPILILAPHTDDGELGCGGTIARLAREGHSIHYIAFCVCDETLPAGFPPGTLGREVREATKILGISPSNVQLLDYEVRRVAQRRQDVLDFLVRLNREIDPQMIFCPTADDLHQDHAAVAAEARRAFKAKTIVGYEMPWNNIHFDANYLVRLTSADVQTKIAALACYKSQSQRPYINARYIEAHAHSRGVTVSTEYAEAFTLYRAVH